MPDRLTRREARLHDADGCECHDVAIHATPRGN